jgi:hypothetical protein
VGSLRFFIDIVLPAAIWLQDDESVTKMSTRGLPEEVEEIGV